MKSRKNIASNRIANQYGDSTPVAPLAVDATLKKVLHFAETEDYDSALALLRSTQSNPAHRNALGVCLMRLGRLDDAVQLFRALVLKSGCTWMKPESPVAFKLNFATALLLCGRPSGCLDALAEVGDEAHPTSVRLLAAIKKWEAGLPWWHWLNWRFGRIDPLNFPPTLDFLPGDFGIPFITVQTPPPASPAVPFRTAA